MTTFKPKISTEQELRSGNEFGIHKVQQPITGYKKIQCDCPRSNFFAWLNDGKTINPIAELEIPTNATIIRPLVTTKSSFSAPESHISTKLRTDVAITKKIKPVSLFALMFNPSNCRCYSLIDNNYEYSVGKEQKPIKDFDDDVSTGCTSGIHFFLEKREAENYV